MGPEAFTALRLDMGPLIYGEVGVRGTMLFLREEAKTRGIPGVMGGVALGARF